MANLERNLNLTYDLLEQDTLVIAVREMPGLPWDAIRPG
jgi:hypothetical protein